MARRSDRPRQRGSPQVGAAPVDVANHATMQMNGTACKRIATEHGLEEQLAEDARGVVCRILAVVGETARSLAVPVVAPPPGYRDVECLLALTDVADLRGRGPEGPVRALANQRS